MHACLQPDHMAPISDDAMSSQAKGCLEKRAQKHECIRILEVRKFRGILKVVP